MKFSMLFVIGSLTLVGCSNTNPVRPESTGSTPSASLTAPASSAVTAIHPSPDQGFGFNGQVSGFPTGRVFVSGGGTFDVASGFVRSSGGFSCLEDVRQGPLSVSINPDDPGPCLQGQGVRWDTAQLLTNPISFKCTGAANESHPQVQTGAGRVVLQADFYRAGDGNDESFTAQMIVSETEIAPGVNLWIQGVGCGNAIVNFSHSH
ncbi:MAG TPA: hypothetical protein VF456_16715 [Vicinamibacterales bacterium]